MSAGQSIAPLKVDRHAWAALILVCAAQTMSMVDRQILAILMPRIKADLDIGDAEMGLLYGTVFALFYALFSLPLGRLADGWIRTRLLSLSIAGWSIATALAGFANSFAVLGLSRLGVGIGEASVQPAGMSLLADCFPKKWRGTINALIAASIALGLGSALWVGGATADAWDAAYPAGNAPLDFKGWQAAFVIAAVPGLLLGVALWRLREPVRGAADNIVHVPDPAPFRASAQTLTSILPGFNWAYLAQMRAPRASWMINIGGLLAIILAMRGLIRWTDGLREAVVAPLRLGGVEISGNTLQFLVIGFGIYVILNWLQALRLRDRPAHALIARTPALVLLFVIAAMQSAINYGIMGWTPTYIIQKFAVSPAQVGLQFGMLIGGLGIIGPLIAGPLADWLHPRVPGGRLLVTFMALLLSPFLALLVYSRTSLDAFYLAFVPYSLILTMWLPPVYATFLDLVLPRMRGSVISFYILTMTIFGMGIGPYAVGMISDRNGGDLGSAILTLYWLAPLLVLLAGVLVRCVGRDEASMIARARSAGEPI